MARSHERFKCPALGSGTMGRAHCPRPLWASKYSSIARYSGVCITAKTASSVTASWVTARQGTMGRAPFPPAAGKMLTASWVSVPARMLLLPLLMLLLQQIRHAAELLPPEIFSRAPPHLINETAKCSNSMSATEKAWFSGKSVFSRSLLHGLRGVLPQGYCHPTGPPKLFKIHFWVLVVMMMK